MRWIRTPRRRLHLLRRAVPDLAAGAGPGRRLRDLVGLQPARPGATAAMGRQPIRARTEDVLRAIARRAPIPAEAGGLAGGPALSGAEAPPAQALLRSGRTRRELGPDPERRRPHRRRAQPVRTETD